MVVRGDEVVVIVPARSALHREVLALPKGHPDPGETPLQAAAREVREETGVEVEAIDSLGEINYTYERRGREVYKRVQFYLFAYRGVYKRVQFYLFAYRGGELSHDHEIADVLWMPLEEAAHSLTHEGEREMVRRALSRASEAR